ncbi:MAG: hypothetical protein GYB24_11450 [Rhodobacteraceae bacterium]|nr:hypothetical protein [Paracoccaceae bacterium]
MKHFAPLLLALALATPVAAQEEQDSSELFKRFEQLSDDAQSMLKGWVDELGPKLDELGPAMEDLAERLGEMSTYHAPEVLENGDILIRRKTPLPPKEEPEEPRETPLTNPQNTIEL